MSVYVPYCRCRLGPRHVWEPGGACPPTPIEPLAEVGLTEKNTERAPDPNACRWCGRGQRDHGWYYAAPVGTHQYTDPTDAQRLSRMRARRKDPR